MAGILDFLGLGDVPQGGILASAQSAPTWQNKLGMFGAALSDAGGALNGRDTNNIGQFQAMLRQQQLRQAYQSAATATDPATRQQAYSAILAAGGDPTALQHSQAQTALPQLLQNLQPSMGFNDNPVGVTPAVNAQGPGVDAARAAALQTNAAPAMSMQPSTLSGALQRTGSPELTAEMAPQLIQNQLAMQTKAMRTLNPQEAAAAGFKPGAVVQQDAFGNLHVAQASDVKSQDAIDQAIALKKADPHLAIDQANLDLARQRLGFEKDKLTSGIPNDDALHDMAVRYVNGDKNAFGAMGRNPRAQTAAQNAISQVGRELGLKPEQISRNQQTFQAGTRAVQAFDTGKQGDTVRSLNVSVAHLETLKELGTALQNGDVRLINAAQQKFAEEFGVPAPTNFDAAKSIVADEVAKGVIGGQTAQQDRETLAASLRRTGSPQAINGAINTFQELLSGQLHGLRKQYETSTGRSDFNEKLFPSTLAAIDRAPVRGAAKPSPSPQDLPRKAVTIQSDADYAKLPSGSIFVGPDGKQRRKP